MVKRFKLPEDPRYRKQVKTFVQRHGRDGYSKVAGRKGRPSPASFNSETGRLAAIRSHEVRRERAAKAAAERMQNNNERSKEGDESLEKNQE